MSAFAHIAHFDLDAFFVSVEILKNPSLKGKPLIVGGDGQRGIVAACSYEARAYGIESAMPALTAKKLCPEAVFIKGSHGDYSKYSRIVTEIIAGEVPVFEKASVDEFYLDLGGLEKFFGISRFTRNLKEKITRETGLPLSYGLSSNKMVSKMATNEAKPNGYLEIYPGFEKDFLWPLDVGKIPGVGKQTLGELHALGFYKIKDLAGSSVQILEKYFGNWGKKLWEKSHGIAGSVVEPYSEQKSISHETTFDEDSNDLDYLHQKLVKLTEETAFSLRKEEKLTGCVSIKIKYADFTKVSKQVMVDFTGLDNILLAHVNDLFDKLYRKGEKIRLLGVKFSHLVPMTLQMNLFDNAVDQLQLYKTVDQLKSRFGAGMITKASTMKKK